MIDLGIVVSALTWGAVALVVVVGFVLGALASSTAPRPIATHLWWQIAGGTCFFIPLAIVRALEGDDHWERRLGTLVLWTLFSVSITIGTLAGERWR